MDLSLVPKINSDVYHQIIGNKNLLKRYDKVVEINKDGVELIDEFNGKNNLKKIFKKKNIKKDDYSLIFKFINILEKKGMIINNKKKLNKNNGVETVFTAPHRSIELTDTCNLNCSYCYNRSSANKNSFLNNPLELLKSLKRKQVRSIEITGGEPLLHPRIDDIIKYSLWNFKLVALLTNGVLLNDKIISYFKKLKDCFIQISLPSLKRSRYKKIMGADNLGCVKNNIRKICNNDINLRIATILIDEESYNEFPDMVKFANEVGALSISGSPVIPIGRGKELMDNYSVSKEIIKNHRDNLRIFSKKYSNLDLGLMYVGDDSRIKKEGNCGIGWKTYFIDPNGKPKLCGFFPEKYSSKLIEDEEIRKKLYNIEAPRAMYCKKCKYENFCKYCILRGWLKSSEKGFGNCNWIQKNKELIKIMNKLEKN